MSGPFKLKYKHSAFPFKKDDKKKKISDDIGYDKEFDIFYDKDIQRSYERGTGRFSEKHTKEYKDWLKSQKNIDREV